MSAPRAGQERTPFVSVAVRVKPSASGSDAPGNVVVWAKQAEGGEGQRRVCCHRGYLLEEYEFSRVFGPQDNNRRLFEELQGPAVAGSVFSGVNETLFAYGQTGSGKTHTIFGSVREFGLLQHFVATIFARASRSHGSTVHVCCYEILGDTLTDLIRPAGLVERGELRPEDVVCDELFLKTHKCRYQIVHVENESTCLELLQEARVNRTAGVSSCNLNSSRSHAVVHLFVQNPSVDLETGGSSSSIGALTLVDLAGAEKEHENPTEQGRKCARLLNTSLSSLNRLLRKLQTNSLDESERRQSVLNKCLWEYLRPGCGIALIFCVSPLLKHRAISLSTLAMATDSKLIHSRRKSQLLQLPAAWQAPPAQAAPGSPACLSRMPEDRTPCARGARARGRTPDAGSTPRGASTPRARGGRCLSSTPARGGGMAAGTGPDLLSSTPRARASGASMASTPRAGRAVSSASSPMGRSALGPESMRRLKLGQELPEDMTGNLEVQNTKLRRKLSRTRARSRDRIGQIEQERNMLNSENAMLRRECESLRSLFIRQQQQQIAFWAGPFMEMILPKTSSQAGVESADAAAVAAPAAGAAEAAVGASAIAACSGSSVGSAEADGAKAVGCPLSVHPPALGSSKSGTPLATLCLHEDKSLPNITTTLLPEEIAGIAGTDELSTPALLDCAGMLMSEGCVAGSRDEGAGIPNGSVQNLLQERDYWQKMATQLQREMAGAQQQLLHLAHPVEAAKPGCESQPRSEPSTSRRGSSSCTRSESGSESPWSSADA